MSDPSQNLQTPRRLLLALIATAHGVRGLVKLKLYTDDPGLLDGPLYTSETGAATLALTMKSSAGKYWLAEIEGIADRTAAEKLRGVKLWIDRDSLPATGNNEYYYSDLIGLDAFGPGGEPAGRVIDVQNFGAGDLLEIQPLSGESYYLPFTKETAPVIDTGKGRITIVRPETDAD